VRRLSLRWQLTLIGTALVALVSALLLWLGWRQMFIAMGVLGVAVAALWYLSYRDRVQVVLDMTPWFEPAEAQCLEEAQ